MNSSLLHRHSPRRAVPPFWASALLCLLTVAFFTWMRLFVIQDRVFPLSSSLPLLLCLWNRDRRLLYGMAVAFTVITFLKIFVVLPDGAATKTYESITLVSQLLNIWVIVGVIHGLLNALDRIQHKNEELEQINGELEASNEELAASNEELAAREEEIARQNEELQSQTEELEQQTEELRQQAEEMEQQSTELQEINSELGRRERGMQTLLDSGRWLRSDMNEELVMNGICQATIQVLGEDIQAAAVVEEEHGAFHVRGDSGFGLNGAVKPRFAFDQSFASIVIERGQTAYIEDIQTRPDIELPRPAAGKPFRSVLASPIWIEGRPVAALEIYSRNTRHWTEQEFQVVEWLAAQAALALQATRFQRELELKRGEAEEASVQKTRFLAAVSHDVRTPANAICLLAELIERMANDPAKVGQVPLLARNLGSNARSLIELVSDVLDLARFDAGRTDLQLGDFSLASLIQAEVKQALPVAENKGLRLSAKLPAEDIMLQTDRMKLARVLSNLIGNAVKFTEIGEVEIRCEKNFAGGIDIAIVDTGLGISSEHLPYIFDEFYQLRNPERDREKGTGLGLAICSRLLDALGCEVSVSSIVNIGTTFTVTIPARLVMKQSAPLPVAPPAAATPPSCASHPLAGVQILLVEDHGVTRRTMAQLLAADGAVVSEASTGREALHMLSHGPHHVMLLDLNLPDIDGTEVLKNLQSVRPEELKCVLVVSGDVRPARVEEVKRLGANDLIPKPLSIDRILQALEGQLN